MEVLIISILSYLMGSVPFGFILTKVFLKKDIRDIGSGNIGATNALRAGNKSLGYGTLFLDIIKAIIPVVYVKLNYPDYIFIASLCVFLGHIFPIWLKFKGGKGVATYVGILFSINLTIGFIFIGVSFLEKKILIEGKKGGPFLSFSQKNMEFAIEDRLIGTALTINSLSGSFTTPHLIFYSQTPGNPGSLTIVLDLGEIALDGQRSFTRKFSPISSKHTDYILKPKNDSDEDGLNINQK